MTRDIIIWILVSVFIACFGFKLVFDAFRSGVTRLEGELCGWDVKKEKQPVLFYIMVAVYFFVGCTGIWLLYKAIYERF